MSSRSPAPSERMPPSRSSKEARFSAERASTLEESPWKLGRPEVFDLSAHLVHGVVLFFLELRQHQGAHDDSRDPVSGA